MGLWDDILIFIARLAMSCIFAWGTYRKLANWQETKESMRSKGIKSVTLLLPIAIIFQIFGILSLIFGVVIRIGSICLIVFTLPATIKMHNFWKLEGEENIAEKAHFFKDIAIIGGLLLFIVTGAGKIAF